MQVILGMRSCWDEIVWQITSISDVCFKSFFGSVASRHCLITVIPDWAMTGFCAELAIHFSICLPMEVSEERRLIFLAYLGLLVSSTKVQITSACISSITSKFYPSVFNSSIFSRQSPSFWKMRSFTNFRWKTGSALIAKIVFVAPWRTSKSSGSYTNLSFGYITTY